MRIFNQCPVCKRLGQKSKLYIQGFSTSTSIISEQFYDEKGKFHSHDSNRTETEWYCDKGHKGIKIESTKCPSCSFGQEGKVEFYENDKLISLPIEERKRLKAPK